VSEVDPIYRSRATERRYWYWSTLLRIVLQNLRFINAHLSDEQSVAKYSARVETEMPQFSIGKDSESLQHDTDFWPVLLRKDVVVVTSTVRK
jgi:hypothetical protein